MMSTSASEKPIEDRSTGSIFPSKGSKSTPLGTTSMGTVTPIFSNIFFTLGEGEITILHERQNWGRYASSAVSLMTSGTAGK